MHGCRRFCTQAVVVLMMLVGLVGCSRDDKTLMQPAVSKLLEEANGYVSAYDLNSAICRLQAAEALMPESYQIQYNLGIVYYQAQQWQSAIDHLKQAIAIDASKPDAAYSLVLAYESLGDDYLAVFLAEDKDELKGRELDEAFLMLPKDKAQLMALEAFKDGIVSGDYFLKEAPDSDRGRSDIERAITAMENKVIEHALKLKEEQ